MSLTGIVPRNYPNSTEEDYLPFTEESHLAAEYVGPYAVWDDPGAAEGLDFVVDFLARIIHKKH